MRITLQSTKEYVDLILKALSILAIIAGGGWAYYQFRLFETNAANIQISVSTETLKYSDDFKLLVIHSKVKNIGKVLVEPGKGGLVLTVRKLADELKPGAVDLAKAPVVPPGPTNILKRYPDGYVLEPSVEYDEVLALVVPNENAVYAASAVLDLGDNDEVDHTTFARLEKN